jgi:P27 family predicted phage terminase small subunit
MPRKIVPTKLKVIKGTFRACRANPNEPVYPDEIPLPTDFLNDYGKKEWVRISKDLFKQGLLASVDMAALTGYCQAFGRWAQAEKDLLGESLTINTIQGNKIQNPLIGIANTSMEHMRKFLIEFGMTPASRSKVSAKKTKKKKDAWAEFG